MKNFVLVVLFLSSMCLSCDDEIKIPEPGENTGPIHLKTIDFSSIDDISEIEDFDVKDGYIYFDFGFSIFRLNVDSEISTPELIVEDGEAPIALKVIGDTLYYQTFWASSSNVKQIDLNNLAAAAVVSDIVGTPRFELAKNDNKLVYLSSADGISPYNNFYEFNPSSYDEQIAFEEFVFPDNIRFVDDFLYFSSNTEIRRIDLKDPFEKSKVVYTVPDINSGNQVGNNGNILGFDISDNVIFFSQIASPMLFSIDLENPNDSPKVLRTNTDAETGYGKLIIDGGKLYVKKISDKKLEVFEIKDF